MTNGLVRRVFAIRHSSLPNRRGVLPVEDMNTMRPSSAKIIQHSEGLGAPNAEQVRHRAQELAIIAGRTRFNDEDWRDAKRELHGGHAEASDDGEMQMSAIVSGHDMVAGSLGHRVENVIMSSEQDCLGEELVAEGMDEAVHEQMLLARREEDDDQE
jgi:hypothetical protein